MKSSHHQSPRDWNSIAELLQTGRTAGACRVRWYENLSRNKASLSGLSSDLDEEDFPFDTSNARIQQVNSASLESTARDGNDTTNALESTTGQAYDSDSDIEILEIRNDTGKSISKGSSSTIPMMNESISSSDEDSEIEILACLMQAGRHTDLHPVSSASSSCTIRMPSPSNCNAGDVEICTKTKRMSLRAELKEVLGSLYDEDLDSDFEDELLQNQDYILLNNHPI